jgi:hypothetical protein
MTGLQPNFRFLSLRAPSMRVQAQEEIQPSYRLKGPYYPDENCTFCTLYFVL